MISITLRTALVDCWSCGCETEIVGSVSLENGEQNLECSVAAFTDYLDLLAILQEEALKRASVGDLKPRYSATMGQEYASNGCAHCDALFGQHYEIHARYNEKDAVSMMIPANERWRRFMSDLEQSEDGHLGP